MIFFYEVKKLLKKKNSRRQIIISRLYLMSYLVVGILEEIE